VFVDSEDTTWNMSPEYLQVAIQDRINKGKKPKAIIVVHLYGMPAQMDEIMAIANRYNIPVIEDAAEALGSSYKGRALGTFGDIGILSFNGNKIITTSGGGALISANAAYVEKARFLATQARDEAPHYEHSHIGYNYRMSNVCAGIGRGQMEVLSQRVSQRRYNFNYYKQALADVEGISFQADPGPAFYSNHWLSTILVESNHFTKDDIQNALLNDNIDCRPLWKPMHLQPVFANAHYYGNGTSDGLFERGLCLPSGSNLTARELERVVSRIREVVNLKKSPRNIINNPISCVTFPLISALSLSFEFLG
jgi:dTDP-4-amino-4,6-dideoxygalactose transaminase